MPGKSNAFAISKRLGLSDYVINRAKEFIDTDTIAVEDVIHSLEKSRVEAVEEKEEASRLRKEIQTLKEEYDEKLEKIAIQREKMLEEARQEAFRITRQAKEETELVIKELRRLEQENMSKEKNRKIEELRREISSSMGALQPSIKSMIVPKTTSKEVKDLKPGDEVKVITLNQQGSVISADNKKKEALVQIGIMKMTLPYKSLQKAKKDVKSTVTNATRNVIKSKSGRVKSEVDLRGMTLEEAREEVDKYLDDACLAGLENVTVIHGIGTGVLKAGITEMLKKHKHVKSQRPGQYGEGGMGVTIVTLK
ncbi:smr domain protein [[Clostridium] sordellii ATCC 9714]|nr:smr domain protein [[Clostridium] sordellii ATCC 9714] [Paeniclostridium sordellii ATCC 9714]